jgi:hypothetical protein
VADFADSFNAIALGGAGIGSPGAGLMKIGDIGAIFLKQNVELLFLWPGFSGLPERQERPSGREQKQDLLLLSA